MFVEPYNNMDLIAINDAYARTVHRLRNLAQNGDASFVSELVILIGSENYLSFPFLEAVQDGRVLTLNGSRYLLVEFPLLSDPNYFSGILEEIIDHDLVPIIAHPERNVVVQEHPQVVQKLVDLGSYCQVDAASVLGRWGKTAQKTGIHLLREGTAHLIASDGHRADYRRPRLDGAFDYLSRIFPRNSVHAWFHSNPRKIVENSPVLNSDT